VLGTLDRGLTPPRKTNKKIGERTMKVDIGAVAEIQGLYGSFSFPEKLLQKIWLRGDFDRARAVTTDGRRVRVLHPGKWNLLGGPDFRDARLTIGESGEINGDVEVHLRTQDWDAHGHARDRAYDAVVLHVVLFPPDAQRVTRGGGGKEIPVLALLPLLHHDLEEYAAEEAVETLANRPSTQLVDELGRLPAGELETLLRRGAETRWRQKVYFARLRAKRLGWAAACHQTALEILGYRFNRAPMLRVASSWPLDAWQRGEASAETAYIAEVENWSVQGVRPANHPRTRLRQYAAWLKARPDWAERVEQLSTWLPEIAPADSTGDARRRHRFAQLRQRIADEVCASVLSGTRLDNLICDGLLPLLATQSDRKLEGLWFHWFTGDVPPFIGSGLRQLGVIDGRRQPACHGIAQGLLGRLIERDARRD
jgi:hypothetical protein